MSAPKATPRPIPPTWARHRYSILLIGLATLMVVAPIVQSNSARPVIVGNAVSVALTVLLLSAVVAVCTTRARAIVFGILLTPTLALYAIAIFRPAIDVKLAIDIADLVVICYVVFLTTRHLFTTHTITHETFSASLCIYLLLGVVWALLFAIMQAFDTDAFAYVHDETARLSTDEGLALYYSLVTLTTLGYGDITPTSRATQMMVVIEAVMGQVYLTVLVARLVGLHIAERARGAGN